MKKPQPAVAGAHQDDRTTKTDQHRPPSYSRPSAPAPRTINAPTDARLRHLAGRIHGLGSGPLYYLLRELVDGADPWPRLEAYGRLAPLARFIAALEGDRLPGLRAINGGRQ